MINQEKIEEWIREVEERPTSAGGMVRSIANRLNELSKWNEELLNDNIELRSGNRVEEYERRISSLEYQVELMRRQLGGEVITELPTPKAETLNIILFSPKGWVLRTEFPVEGAQPGQVARFASTAWDFTPGLVVVNDSEELLFLFDSGRTLAQPVSQLPLTPADELDWEKGVFQDPRGGEELAAVIPIGRLALYDHCIQVSRRGCVKNSLRTAFHTYLDKGYIGAGVKSNLDRTCGLAFCAKNGHIALASQEGAVVCFEAGFVPFHIDEAIRLSVTDTIITSFSPTGKDWLLFITNNGKAVQRESAWLTPTSSLRSRGQAVIPSSRKEAGVRLAAAGAVDESDWAAALDGQGGVHLARVKDLFNTGSLSVPGGVLAATFFSMPPTRATEPDRERGA